MTDKNDLPSGKSIDDDDEPWELSLAAKREREQRYEYPTPEKKVSANSLSLEDVPKGEPAIDQEEDSTEPLLGVVYPATVTFKTSGLSDELLEILTGQSKALLDEVPEPERSKVLSEADALINGDRQQEYGTPQVNFQRIADLWNVLIPGHTWTTGDVALAMLGVKLARAAQGYKRDTYVDIAGYAALAVELNETDNG